jgi:hypothetical protein
VNTELNLIPVDHDGELIYIYEYKEDDTVEIGVCTTGEEVSKVIDTFRELSKQHTNTFSLNTRPILKAKSNNIATMPLDF